MGNSQGCTCFDTNSAMEKEKKKNNKKQTINDVKELKTKQSIETARLMAEIIIEFFKNKDNICQIREKENKPLLDVKEEINGKLILDNIVLFGGTVRDLKLGRAIKDVDLQTNTRKLNKLFKLHLETYHKTLKQQKESKNCVFWRLYQNKFKDVETDDVNDDGDDGDDSDDDEAPSEIQFKYKKKEEKIDKNKWEYISKCNYIVNTNFIVDILLNSKQLKDKHKIKRYTGHWPSAEILINKDLIHNNINLCNTDIDFCIDPIEYKPDPAYLQLMVSGKDDDDDKKDDDQQEYGDSRKGRYKYGLMRRFSSIDMMNLPIIDQLQQEQEEQEEEKPLEIDVPIHDTKLVDAIAVSDLSINTMMAPLSNFIGDKDNEYYYKWDNIDKFVCALPNNYDILRDYEEKILTQHNIRNVILGHGPPRHLLRLQKFAIRMSDWKVDQKVIDETKKCYKYWIDFEGDKQNKYWNAISLKNNYKFFISGIFTYSGAKTIKNYKKMIQLWDEWQFTQRFLNVINDQTGTIPHIKKLFIQELNKIKYDDKEKIINLFKEKGFPTTQSDKN